MDDNQLDRLFREELGEYEAPDRGAKASWARLQSRGAAPHSQNKSWIWILLVLLGAAAATAAVWRWAMPPQIVATKTTIVPHDPSGTKEAQLPLQTESADSLTESSLSAERPYSFNEDTAQPLIAVTDVNQPISSVPPAPSARESVRTTDSSLRQSLRPETRQNASESTGNEPETASVGVSSIRSQRIFLLANDSLVKKGDQLNVAIIGWENSDLIARSDCTHLTDRRPQHAPSPTWRWVPDAGAGIGIISPQLSGSVSNHVTAGFQVNLLRYKGIYMGTGLWRDVYRTGSYQQSLLRNLSIVESDFAPPEVPISSAPPPADTTITYSTFSRGFLIPLRVSYRHPIAARWEGVVSASALLRYQDSVQLERITTISYQEQETAQQVDEVIARDVQSVYSSFANAPPSLPRLPRWQQAGAEVSVGVRYSVANRCVLQIEGLWQARRALMLPSATPYRSWGVRATLWWER